MKTKLDIHGVVCHTVTSFDADNEIYPTSIYRSCSQTRDEAESRATSAADLQYIDRMLDPLSKSEGGARLAIKGVASENAVYLDPNLQIAFYVALMAVLRVGSVAPAFPDIGRAFHVSSDSVSLLTTAFALPSVFLTPILGILADHWGRKRVLVPSLMLFGLAGGACALARDFELLLALRFLHGIGAASLSMLNITLVADLFEGRVRTTAMRYNAMVRGVGAALFPLLGGVLATLGWYYPFTLALLAIPAALAALLRLRNPEPSEPRALRVYLDHSWHSLRNWQVIGFFTAGFVVFVTMFGCYLTYFPFLLEDRFSASPMMIGLLMFGRSVINVTISSQLGKVTKVWPVSTLLKTSFALYTLVFVIIPLISKLWAMALVTLLLGTAEGFFWPSSLALLGILAPMKHRAGFTATNDTVWKLGQVFGPLLMAGVFRMWGIAATFYVAAALSLATFALTIATVRLKERSAVG